MYTLTKTWELNDLSYVLKNVSVVCRNLYFTFRSQMSSNNPIITENDLTSTLSVLGLTLDVRI